MLLLRVLILNTQIAALVCALTRLQVYLTVSRAGTKATFLHILAKKANQLQLRRELLKKRIREKKV